MPSYTDIEASRALSDAELPLPRRSLSRFATNGAGSVRSLFSTTANAPDPELAKPLGGQKRRGEGFPRMATSVVEPYSANLPSKLLTSLGLLLAPFYLAYLWLHRRAACPIFGIVFFAGELINFGLGFVGRMMLWHRQYRRVCRLDCLSPPFPRHQWPMVHIFFTHYMEPPEESVKPLRQAVQQDYPSGSYVVTILDDSYYKRQGEGYEVNEIGREMEEMIYNMLAKLTPQRHAGIAIARREASLEREGYRPEVAPGGSTIVEFQAEGLPLVRLIGRKKGPDSYMKTGNLENGLWNVMEEDVRFMVVLDSDMAPTPDMLQMLLPPMLEYHDGAWGPDWRTAYVSSPQDFRNITDIWGADDPMNQASKFFFRILPTALDSLGLVHFWGTNVAFFVPALKDTTGFVYGCMTEDTVTGEQLHRFGWKSAYVGSATMTLATGLCRESVAGTFDQRKRWTQGNIQQLYMVLDPPCILHESFRFPPYRRELRSNLQETKQRDRSSEPALAICEGDAGAEDRRARRTIKWAVLRELAYFPSKWAFLYHTQPIYYYAITLAVLYTGQPPFAFVSGQGFLGSFQIVLTYWVINSLANFCGYSFVLDDPENASSTLWRSQQEFYGYAWVRVIGILEGSWSAMTGKQPKWQSFGMGGDMNLVYEVPNAIAFLFMASSMAAVGVNYYMLSAYGVGSDMLPGPAQVSATGLAGTLLAGLWVLVLMWPVTSCIFADFLGVPYYRLGAILTTLVAAMVQVGISIFFFSAQVTRN